MSIKATISTTIKGRIALYIRAKDIFATFAVTKSVMPTGGVTNPTQRLTTTMTPKCSGFIPRAVAVGTNIGVIIKSAGARSMIIPINNNRIFAKSKKMNLLLAYARKN